jgi:hypothetical protein
MKNLLCHLTSPKTFVTGGLALGLFLTGGSLAYAGLPDVIGHYEGAWTNLTFGSTGKAVIDIQVTGTNATLIFDMDGYVFGYIDPPLISMPGTVTGSSIYIDNKGVGIFGDIKGLVDGAMGTFSVTLTNIPGNSIQHISVIGTIQGGRLSLDYTVDFYGPSTATNPAHGVLVASAAVPLKITRVWRQTNDLILEWTGGRGPYQIQTRTNLVSGAWSNLGSSLATTTTAINIGTDKTRFFRAAGQ